MCTQAAKPGTYMMPNKKGCRVSGCPFRYGLLAGGFNHFLCSPLFGEDSHFDWYFSDGLKPYHQPVEDRCGASFVDLFVPSLLCHVTLLAPWVFSWVNGDGRRWNTLKWYEMVWGSCCLKQPRGWMKFLDPNVAKPEYSYEWFDAKQRDKTSRAGRCFPKSSQEGRVQSFLQHTKTPGTIAKTSAHLSSSLWINEAVVAGKPHHEAWQEQRFGWFVYGKFRDMGNIWEHLHLWHFFLVADIEDGLHVEWRRSTPVVLLVFCNKNDS